MPMRRPLKPLTAFSHWVVFAEHVLVYGDQLVTGDMRLRLDPCPLLPQTHKVDAGTQVLIEDGGLVFFFLRLI